MSYNARSNRGFERLPWNTAAALLIASAALVACDDDGGAWSPPAGPPFVLAETLAYLDPDTPQLHLLDLDGDPRSEAERVPLPCIARRAAPRPQADELLLSCDPDDEDGAQLVAVDGEGETRAYPLDAELGTLQASADGRWAALFVSEDDASGGFIRNPNRLSLVDLEREPGPDNPVHRTLLGWSGAPTQVLFSPEMTLAGSPRRLAVVLSDTYLSIFDLSHLDRNEITVPFDVRADQRSVRPAQVLFDPEAAALYVRAEDAEDVFVVSLTEDVDDVSDNDFIANRTQLGAGERVLDMMLYEEADGRTRLLVAAGSRLVVLDPRSAATTVIPLESYGGGLLRYEAGSPLSPEPHPQVLVHGGARESDRVAFVDLSDLEQRGSRNIETLPLQPAVRHLELALPRGLAVMDSQAGFTLLDLEERSAAPIYTAAGTVQVDAEAERLWLSAAGQRDIGFLDLGTLRSGELRLDRGVNSLFVIPGARRIVADHAFEDGYVTVIDADDPDVSTAVSLRGFLWADLFDRGGAL